MQRNIKIFVLCSLVLGLIFIGTASTCFVQNTCNELLTIASNDALDFMVRS